MGKVAFTNLKIKDKEDINTITFNGINIDIAQQVSTSDAVDLIEFAAAHSFLSDGIYDMNLADAYFHLYLIYLITNINFTDKQKEDELKLYDMIRNSGLLDAILAAFNEDRYNELVSALDNRLESEVNRSNTICGIFDKFIVNMPDTVEKASEIIKDFNPDQVKMVMDLAQSFGMNNKA